MQTIEGGTVSAKELAVLEANESPTFASRPSYATVAGGAHWDLPLLLLTDRRLLLIRDRMFGKLRADYAARWSDVSRVSGDLWNGGGPKIQLIVQSKQGDVELIVPPQYAADVEGAIRARYLR